MSGPIQKLIGPTKARLLCYLDAATLLTVPVDEKTLDEQEIKTGELINGMDMNTCLSEKCNRDRVSLLRELQGEEKVKEEKTHLQIYSTT